MSNISTSTRTVIKLCMQCNKPLTGYIQPSKPKKYCNSSCFGRANRPKGSIPWNKGIKGTHFSPATEFKKGITPTGSMVFTSSNIKFQGTPEEYKALHHRINKLLGKPDTCSSCREGNLKGRKIHWANISGKYLEHASDWVRLCAKCHYYFDEHHKRKVKSL